MSSLGIVVLIIGALVGVALVAIGARGPRSQGGDIEERLAQLGTLERPPSLEEIELSLPFTERILRPRLQKMAEFISRLTPAQTLTRTRRNLELAGASRRISTTEFLSIRFVLMGVLGAGAIVFASTSQSLSTLWKIIIIPAGAIAGNYLPVLWLNSRMKQRQKEIIRALPDVLDLLTICVEAGLGFDAAMARVVEKWDNELTRAFGRVLQEIRLGKLRREALRDMADSVDVNDLSTFVAAVIQADQLGVSIAKVLRIQSEQMRVRRRQRAEEEGRKAPVKIALPTVLLIFPSLLIPILGPAALQVMNIFSTINTP